AVAVHLDAAQNLARWLTGNTHDAEDVVQEAWVRAWRYRDSFRGGNLRAWLLALVRNTGYTWLERNRPSGEGATVPLDALPGPALPADEASDPAKVIERLSDRALVTEALERLPAEQREILVLREMEDLAYKEIADILEVPIGTVMSRLARARGALA